MTDSTSKVSAPHLVTLDAARDAAGVSIRTNNQREIDPAIAQIGTLWQRFFNDERIGRALAESRGPALGVYTSYASDQNGDYTLFAALPAGAVDGLDPVTIPAGTYLVFEGTGAMPRIVIDTWIAIWKHFEHADQEVVRTFTTDFEEYGADTIRIHIAVTPRT